MRDTVVILGSHPDTSKLFDLTRQDCDVWVFNEAAQKEWVQNRPDGVFQLHSPVIFRNPGNRNHTGHYDWLKSGNTPTIYMQEAYEDIPKAEALPLDELIKIGMPYFTSSVAYALALAIYKGYKRIEVWGVEMETDTEYRFQRDGVTFWLGVAIGRGIDVDIHSKGLMKAPLYGFDGDVKLSYEYFQERVKGLKEHAEPAKEELDKQKEVMFGVIDEYMNNGGSPDVVVNSIKTTLELASKYGQFEGGAREDSRYLKKADVMIAATGDFVFVRQEYEQAGKEFYKLREKQLQVCNNIGTALGNLFDKITNAKNAARRRSHKLELRKILLAYINETINLGGVMGCMTENKIHIDTLTQLIRAAGGEKSEAVMLEAIQAQMAEAVPA